MFSIHFLWCNLVVSALLGFILLFKKVFKGHLTLKGQYYLWHVFVFAALLPFIPYKRTIPARLYQCIQALLRRNSSGPSGVSLEQSGNATLPDQLGLSDFAASDPGSGLFWLNKVFLTVWILGCLVTITYYAYTMIHIHIIRRSAYLITEEQEPDLYLQYAACLKELNIKRNVSLYASCRISSPISYGLIYPKVLIPQDMDILLPEEDVRFIFLHELQHYKRKDAALNYITCLLQIIYWFNPLIWYGFQILQRDREIACDSSVIQIVGKEQSAHYGYTLIRYAEKMQYHAFLSPLSHLGGKKKVIVQRIKEIADFQINTSKQKTKSVVLILLACTIVYCISPFLTVYAFQDDTYQGSLQNTETRDLSSYFKGAEGSFVLYDTAGDRYQIYNQEMSTRRVSPDSTFKIYSGLFALEEGLISPDFSGKHWDGTEYSFDSWNQDQTLATAMQNSVNWYFQDLDAQLGYQKLSSYYRKINYGNCDVTAGTDRYWAEASLKISPAEQVILLSDLLNNRWGFQEENIQAIKDSLFISNTPIGKLYGKTGTGMVDNQNANGWFVGFIEQGEQIYCFATNLQADDGATGSAASEITMDILDSIFSPFYVT